eukprot:TRINITY_DN4104_c0_g2_i15.p2 TRINITY_DN4104_c0_g2~~TRINITY_DN4104_c0_g2_i15.p2  ORF type:complete len:203 (-),score=69.94 TRINITY_DN4104_c0_g2_i15:30-638(-)
MIRRPPRSTQSRSSAASDVYKRQYVLLKERNAIRSDNTLKRKMFGKRGPQPKLSKIKVTMARLLTIVGERSRIREEYRKTLEDQYVEQKRREYESQLELDKQKKEQEPYIPKISMNLLRAKWKALRSGVDNLQYLKDAIHKDLEKQALLKDLNDRYDYQNKKVVSKDTEVSPEEEAKVIREFDSGILEQLKRVEPFRTKNCL